MTKLVKENEMVVTINDTTEKRSDCRRINGIFYKIGDISVENSGQCYIINEKYYKSNTGYIVFDHTLKQYVIKNATNLSVGVVGLDGDKLIEGFFSNAAGIDLPKLITPEGDQFTCVSNEAIKGGGYLMNLRFNAYAHRLKHRVEEFINPGQVHSSIKNGLPYDSRGQMSSLIKYHQDVYKPTIGINVSKYSKLLGDLTFGVEFETIKGQVPQSLTNELGMIALRDGSIGGLEYATIPLKGDKGIQTLINGVDALKKYTTYDKSCSIHYHIGNVPRTEGFMLALFKTLCTLENQMYEIFPLYKQFNYGVKRKHYTRPYPLNETMFQFDKVITKDILKDNFSILYSYLSMGQKYKDVGYDLSNVEYHPSDPRGHSKWNIRSR